MALTAAERKRLQVERERAHARRQQDLVYPISRPGFGAWINEALDGTDQEHLEMCYDGMNRRPPDFSTESDPVSATDNFVFPSGEDGQPSYRGALGRAELEVELLLEAAKTLATMINAYKRQVISDRLAAIETEELSDLQTRRARLAEVVELTRALDRLDRSVRTEVPQWQLRG